MSTLRICPICGSQIVSRSEQFRSDDEPATLVSMCPKHGTVGSLCKLYLESSSNVVIDTSSRLQPTLVSGPSTHTLSAESTESWVIDCDFYTIKVDISNSNLPDMLPCKYMSVQTNCIIDNRSCMCTRYSDHPLYNHCRNYENGIGFVTQSRTSVGPFLINKIRVLSGITIDVHMKDPPFVNCSYAVMCNDGRDGSVSVCCKNVDVSYSSIIVMSKTYSDLIQTLQTTYNMLSDRHTRLYAGSLQNSWLSQTLSLSSIYNKTVLHIQKNIMQGNEDGSFISTKGDPSVLYINNQICIVIYIKGRRCVLFDLNMRCANHQLTGIYKAYIHKCSIFVDRSLSVESCDIRTIVDECGSANEVDRVHTSN